MSPVEEIRTAAASMRERAKAAGPGPWHQDEHQAVYSADGTYVTSPWTSDEVDPDLAHIAGMHPAVALAVADWLDSTSRDLEAAQARYRKGWTNPPGNVANDALNVARAYLGGGS